MQDHDSLRLTKDSSRIRLGGSVYEFRLAGLVTARLRGMCRSQPDLQLRFRMATNVNGANPFDDLVLHLWWRHQAQERKVTYFVQLKHAERMDKLVSIDDLTSKKDFNLRKYFEFYRKLTEVGKKSPQELSGNERVLCDWAQNECRFVLFTNRCVLPERKRTPLKMDFPFHEVFDTGQGEMFSFGEADTEVWNMLGENDDFREGFLPRLCVFSAQAQVSKLEPLLIRALRDALDEPLPRQRQLLTDYNAFLQGWWESDEGDCLSENTTEVEEIVREDVHNQLELLSFQSCYHDELVQRLRSCDASYIVVQGIPSQLQASLIKPTLDKSHPKRFIVLTKITLEEYPLHTITSLCSKICDEVVMCLDYFEESSWEILLETLLSSKKCNVRVMSSEWNEGPVQMIINKKIPWNAWSEAWAMTQLEEQEQVRLLRARVSFQGREMALGALSEAWPSMRQGVRTAALGELAAGRRLALGAPLPPPDAHFVPRTLEHRSALDPTVFQMRSSDDGFILKGFREETLREIRSEHSLWEETSLSAASTNSLSTLNSNRPVETKWCLWENSDCINQMKISHKNLHWLTFEKGMILWDRTDGDIRCLTQYVRKIFTECKELHNCVHNDLRDFLHCTSETVFVHANAGVGKSTFLMKLGETIREEDYTRCVVLVQVSEGKTMEKLSEEMELRDIIHVLQLSLCRHSTLHIDTETRFLTDTIQNSGKISVLVDGVDEVCPAHKVKVLRFLELLQGALEKSGGRLWVAARSVLEEDLARTLHCATPLSLRPFSREDQQNYLLSLWGQHVTGVEREALEARVGALVDAVREATKSGDSSLCDVPLYTRMLADAYTMNELQQRIQNSRQFTGLTNRFSLYQRFVQKTLSRVLIKRGISESDQMNCDLNFDETLKKHCRYAALECFNDKETLREHYDVLTEAVNKLQMDEEVEKVANTGIITQIVDGKPKFLHYTLAEYLAADWLKDKLASLPELTLALYSGEFGEVRYFLDALLAEGHPLHEAALSGRAEAVEEALRREGQLVDAEDAGGRRALHLAAIYGYEPVSRVLIEYGADVHVRDRVMGWAPLAYIDTSCFRTSVLQNDSNIGQLATAEQLLRARADSSDLPRILKENECFSLALKSDYKVLVRRIMEDGHLFSRKLWYGNWYYIVLRHGSVNALETLLDTGFYNAPRWTASWKPTTLLHDAAEVGFSDICGLLLQRGFSVNKGNYRGDTPLQVAASNGHESICHLLLTRGADVHILNYVPQDALYFAAFNGHESICRLLLEEGARVTQKYKYSQSILHVLPQRGNESIYKLMIEWGADVNATDDNGQSPLHSAAICGSTNLCSLLLDNEASVNSMNSKGETAIFQAAQRCNFEMCQLLVDRDADVNLSNVDGHSPLFNAVYAFMELLPKKKAESYREGASCMGVCQLLLKNGADVNAALPNGLTVLHVAARGGDEELCRLLLHHRARIDAETSEGATSLQLAQEQNHEGVCRLLERAPHSGQHAHTSERH